MQGGASRCLACLADLWVWVWLWVWLWVWVWLWLCGVCGWMSGGQVLLTSRPPSLLLTR